MAHSLRHALLATFLLAACDPAPKEGAPTKPAEPAKQAEPAKPAEQAKPAEPAKQDEPAPTTATASPEPIPISTGTCDEKQAAISKEADERAKPYGIVQHLTKNFPDMKISWLMKESAYQSFVVKTGAESFGRCDDTGCYLFAAPTAVIDEAVKKSLTEGGHDPAVIGQALGLPAANFEGPLRMMTLDLDEAPGACVRLPVDSDPGVWKCQSEEDQDCFKFGGYTSGNVPEVMVVNAPVAAAEVKEIQ